MLNFNDIGYTQNTYSTEPSDKVVFTLDNWFPNLTKFNRNFIQFMRLKGINEEDFERIVNPEHFVTSTKRYLKEFAALNEKDYLEGLYEQIKEILSNNFKFDSDTLEEALKSITAANFSITPEYFYDKYVISSKLIPIVNRFRRQSSFNKLNASLTIWYPISPKMNSIVVNFLKLENVEVKTINEMSESQTKFNEYLQSHVYDITRAHREEVQEGIYDQIRVILREDYQGFQDKHEAIINDLKSSNKLIGVFWLNLIYDKTLMKKIVDPKLRVSVAKFSSRKIE